MTTLVESPSTVKVDTAKPPAKPSKPRPPRKPAARSIMVLELPAADDPESWLAVRILEGKKEDTYLVGSLPCAIGGRAFTVEKLDAQLNTVKVHHVRIGAPLHCSCDCEWMTLGRQADKKPCRHIAGLLALEKTGQLPPVRNGKAKHHACNNCQERTDAPGLCSACEEDQAYYHGRLEQEAREAFEQMDAEPPELPESAYFDPAEEDVMPPF